MLTLKILQDRCWKMGIENNADIKYVKTKIINTDSGTLKIDKIEFIEISIIHN